MPQLVEGDPSPAGQRVAFGQRHEHRGIVDLQELQPAAGADERLGHEREVDLAGAQGVDLFLEREVHEMDARVLPAPATQLGHGADQRLERQLPVGRDVERLGGAVSDVPRLRDELGQPLGELRQLALQVLPRRGELHPALLAIEQRHPQLGLQIADLPAQRRLRDVQPLGGPAEVEGLRHGEEVAEVSKFHGPQGGGGGSRWRDPSGPAIPGRYRRPSEDVFGNSPRQPILDAPGVLPRRAITPSMPFPPTLRLLLVVLLCCGGVMPPAVAQTASPRGRTIVVVRDTPSWLADPLEAKIRRSLAEMTAGRAPVRLLDRAAPAGDETELRHQLVQALADPEADYVLVLGTRAVRLAADPGLALAKPVLGAAYVDPDLLPLPLDTAGRSQKENFAVVVLRARTGELLARVRETVSFSAVQLLVDEQWAGDAAALAAWRGRLAQEMGGPVHVVPLGAEAAPALAALDRSVPTVCILPSVRLDAAQHAALLDGLRAGGFRSVSYLGRPEVEAGALAGVLPEVDTQLARRVAVVFDQLDSGAEARALELTVPWQPALYFNETTAAAVGFAPKFQSLLGATVIRGTAAPAGPELRLATAVALALERNYALRARGAGTEASRQDVKAAAGQLQPQLAAVSTYERIDLDRAQASGGIYQEKTWFAGLGLRQSLFDDEAWTRVRIARAALDAATALERVQRLDTATQAAQAYLQLLSARAALRVAEENARTIARHLELAQLRQRIGTSGPEDILRFESLTAQQQAETTAARARVEQARTALNRVLGVEAAAEWSVRDVAPADPEFAGLTAPLMTLVDDGARFERLRQYITTFAVGHSPDIAAAEQGVEAQRLSTAQKERRRYVPKVEATAYVGRLVEVDYGGPTLAEQLRRGGLPVAPVDLNRFSWTVGLQATVPLYTGGSLTADQRKAQAQLREMEFTRDGAREAVIAAAQAQLYALESSHRNIALSRTAAELAERNLGVVRDKYEQGAVSIVTLLEAQTAAFAQRQGAEVALYRFLGDVVQLQRLCGRLESLNSPAENAAWLAEIHAAVAP